MNRRQFIKTTGIVGISLLTGLKLYPARMNLSAEDLFEARLKRGEYITNETFKFSRRIDLNAGGAEYRVDNCRFNLSPKGGFEADPQIFKGQFHYNYVDMRAGRQRA